MQYQPSPDKVVNFGYRYRESLLEQWDAGFAWRISENWQLYARQVYSTREDKSLDRFAGFEYGGCCWRRSPAGPELRVEPHRRKRQFRAPAGGTQGPLVGRNPERHFPGARHSGILTRLRIH